MALYPLLLLVCAVTLAVTLARQGEQRRARRGTIMCPFCAERIQARANICPHCREDVSDPD